MNKILVSMVLTLMLLATTAFSVNPPCPVSGIVKTIPSNLGKGLTVDLMVNNNVDRYFVTNEYSEFAFDMGDKYYCDANTKFTLRIRECQDDPRCTKTVSPLSIVEFDLTGISFPEEECEKCLPFDKENCLDNCLAYFDCNLCDCPTSTTLPCPECECDDKEGFLSGIWEIVLVILSALGLGSVGFSLYKKKSGGVGLSINTHRHDSPGGDRMHSIYTLHSNQPHKKGCWDPVYIDGKYRACSSGKHDHKLVVNTE